MDTGSVTSSEEESELEPMIREQRVLLDSLERIMNKMTNETRQGFMPIINHCNESKIFMQHLTKEGYGYKDDLPAHLQEEWKRYREELKVLNTIKVPRHWRHVASEHNAADVLSRGMTASKFAEHAMWFYGPMFLHGSSSTWPAPFIATNEELIIMNPPKVSQPSVMTITKEEDIIYTIQHNNSFNKLLRVIAYMMRFRRKKKYISHTIEFEEIMEARKIVFRNIQNIDFKDDIKHLKRQRETLKGSSINSLSPFLDQNGILRVGGRLEAANISFDSKHPILLPYNDPVVKMILVQIHKDNMHCGPQALLTTSRQQFWILKGKTMARSTVKACVKCTKAKPKLMEQIMGNLPPLRVTQARPFFNSGVDYCGPFKIHYKVRGKKPSTAYIAIFCCFATKAVHLELVSDLTTEAFLAALRRFIARRGKCQVLHCDNATNFVGAKNKLQELQEAIFSDNAKTQILQECNNKEFNLNSFHLVHHTSEDYGKLQ
ncbi:uncharacterized protein LOC132798069 [Drosophila nasuta]|uniref:uncharacterized protein LOC132798069 n=1 Tax=Drosophila nasuta TaxID=42062 RepID=UPI00295E6091|nr:uncharacterized protein LOC132798069 [Drosophila nasuta]